MQSKEVKKESVDNTQIPWFLIQIWSNLLVWLGVLSDEKRKELWSFLVSRIAACSKHDRIKFFEMMKDFFHMTKIEDDSTAIVKKQQQWASKTYSKLSSLPEKELALALARLLVWLGQTPYSWRLGLLNPPFPCFSCTDHFFTLIHLFEAEKPEKDQTKPLHKDEVHEIIGAVANKSQALEVLVKEAYYFSQHYLSADAQDLSVEELKKIAIHPDFVQYTQNLSKYLLEHYIVHGEKAIWPSFRQACHRAIRQLKLKKSKLSFPNNKDLASSHSLSQASQIDCDSEETLRLCGRVMTQRVIGKSVFTHIQDQSGQLQLYANLSSSPESFELLSKGDLGDIIFAQGRLFKTRMGEQTLKCEKVEILNAALLPMPDKHHGVKDPEIKSRMRYLDLIANETSRKVFMNRSAIIHAIRNFFVDKGFLEVETPQLHPIAGGAIARPFTTHHNTLDLDLYLRIAPELYLKRLIVGGLGKVFEIGKSFRNEGVSSQHNPEFTMLEYYWSYACYEHAMELTEKLFTQLCRLTNNDLDVLQYRGHDIKMTGPYQRLTMAEAVAKYVLGSDKDRLKEREHLLDLLGVKENEKTAPWGHGKLLLEVFEKRVEHLLIHPTFITEHPLEVSPLARKNDHDPEVTDRFELFIGGMEVANGFSELNDPQDQKERFLTQLEGRESGDDEQMLYDADYITALEYGMPPAAGEGIGIDRLVMLLTGRESIRDVMLFPLTRPI